MNSIPISWPNEEGLPQSTNLIGGKYSLGSGPVNEAIGYSVESLVSSS